MARLTLDQVFALATDPGSASAGRDLAVPGKWESAGANDAAVWGEARGSGQNPYQTAVDLRELAYKCTCPSRKFPCKHALGLLIRYAKGEVAAAPAPNWVQEWLEKRAEKTQKQAERVATVPDPEAAAKRAEKRWGTVLSGIEECEAFLEDMAAQGLLAAQSARTWDQMAARMVDAQAPGAASRLRRIGARIGVGERWAHEAAGQIGSLALLMEAAKRVELLDEGLRADVLAAIGIPVRKESLEQASAPDLWDVLGQTLEEGDRVTACRTWMKSRTTGRWAMHLCFQVPGQPFDLRPIPGTGMTAAVQDYPSAWPLRVNMAEWEVTDFRPRSGRRIGEELEFACQIWERSPWVETVPMHLEGCRLGRDGRTWHAIDGEGDSLALLGPEPYELLARTGNEECSLCGEWGGRSLRLLGAWGPWGHVAL